MLILHGGTILPMVGEPFVGDIAIEGGKIKAMGADLTADHAEVYDVTGKYLMPGLVDAHSHLGLFESGTRETDLNEVADPITPQLRGIDSVFAHDKGVAEARSFGITTSVVGPGSANLIAGTFAALKSVGSTVDEMIMEPCVAMKMALGENPKFLYSKIGKSPKTRMGSAALIRETILKAKEYAEKKKNGENVPLNFKLEAMLPVIRREIPMKIHCHRADDIATAIRLMEEFNLRYTLDHCTEGYLITDALAAALQKNCEGIIIGPSMLRKSKLEFRHAMGTKTGKLLYDAGIPFAICTDWAETSFETLMIAAARTAAEGVPEDTVLRAITIKAAQITGLADRIGSLEVGKDADIAVFTGYPLEYSSLCCETYINGKKVYTRD